MKLPDAFDFAHQVERSLSDRADAKGAAAFVALSSTAAPEIVDLAGRDQEGGGQIAIRWRDGITAAFDEAGLFRSRQR